MTIRIGIIGAGAIVEHAFLPGFAAPGSPQAACASADWFFDGCPGAQVVMLASRGRERLERLADKFGVPAVTTDWRGLIESRDLDAVCVATPNYLHHPMTVAAARAGKHVLVEKPMALTMEQARDMVNAADKAGVLLMVHQNQRFAPEHEVAKQIVDSGILGPILSMRARWSHAGPENWSPTGAWFFSKAEAGHGAMFDLGIHKFDLMRFMTRFEVAEVSAFTAALAKRIEVEDQGVAALRFTSGALGVVEASWASPPNENSIKLYGTRGSLQVGLESDPRVSASFEKHPEDAGRLPAGEWQGERYLPRVPGASRLGGPFRHFVDCITTGRECIASGADNLKSLEIALAAFRSAVEGRVIRLPLPGEEVGRA